MANKKDDFISQLEDEFGEDIIEREEDTQNLKVIPTGSISLDLSIGVGGIPLGKITEFYGVESSGKTTSCLAIAKNAINLGYNVLYIEPENNLDYNYIRALIGDVDKGRFILTKPETMEQSLQICENGIRSGEFNLVILDSIAAMSPEKELKKELGESTMALVSRAMSQFLRRNVAFIKKNEVALVFVNQVRDKIGSPVPMLETPGGHAVKHFASLRISLARAQDITQNDAIIGILSKFVIKKNKVAPPFKASVFPIIFGKGIDSTRDVVTFAELLGILEKRGAYYFFDSQNIGQGMTKVMEYLDEHHEVLDKVIQSCYNCVGLKNI